MRTKAYKILTNEDTGYTLIPRDDDKKIIQLNAFEFELDEDNDNTIYYDVKSDIWGTYAHIDYKLYETNLAETIKNILTESNIQCKINKRLGKIRIL